MVNSNRGRVIMLMLVALVSIAVYINVSYRDGGGTYPVTNQLDNVEAGKVLGQAKPVSGEQNDNWTPVINQNEQPQGGTDTNEPQTGTNDPEPETPTNESDYFAKARLLRTKTRDEAVSLLKSIAQSEEADDQTRQKAFADISQMAMAVDAEGRIENLVKAKGFADCIAYISDGGINLVVKSDGLDAVAINKIKDIVLGELNVTSEQIKIVETK